MKQCFECEKTEDQIEMHNHHVVPRSKGGTKTISLCCECHGLVHGKNMMNMGNLISHAAQARLARGYVATTPPYGFTVDEDNKMIQEEAEHLICNAVKWGRYSGYSWKKMAQLLNERGYYNRSGRPWSLHNLRAIFIKREGFKKRKIPRIKNADLPCRHDYL